MFRSGVYSIGIIRSSVSVHERSSQERVDPQITGSERINKLLAELKNEDLINEDPARLANIIEKLGQLRAVKAIPDLIEYLDFRIIHDWEGTGMLLHPLPPGGDFPAVGALGSIGKPALRELIKVIKNENPESVRSRKAGEAIQEIFRDDLNNALEYLNSEMSKADSPEKRENLNKLKIEILCPRDRDCVIRRIIRWGNDKDIAAIPELIRYLDYERIYPEPPQPAENLPKSEGDEVIGVEVGKTITISGHYPATGALIPNRKSILTSLDRSYRNRRTGNNKSNECLIHHRIVL